MFGDITCELKSIIFPELNIREDKKMKVAIAVDLSNVSVDAFDWYMKHLHESDNEVYVCHQAVQPDLPEILIAGSGPFPQFEYDKLVKEYQCRSQDVRERYTKKGNEYQLKNFKILIEKTHKNPGQGIIKQAEEIEANMIIVGTRGMGALRRTILGSVSDYVVHHSKMPVLVYHKK